MDATTQKVPEQGKKAVLYRKATPGHLCPYGLKSKWILERQGYEVDDRLLTSAEEAKAFMTEHDVKTTPQTFIDGARVGGYDALKERFWTIKKNGKKDGKQESYWPVIAIFSVALLIAFAISWRMLMVETVRPIEFFAATAMALLAVQKLTDVESFSTMFLNYDLLARRRVTYSYIYPFAEAFAGVAMLAGGAFAFIGAPVALFIGSIGAASVIKAVYIDKRELKCACVGGNSSVPLGPVSLTENLVMLAMGAYMLIKPFI